MQINRKVSRLWKKNRAFRFLTVFRNFKGYFKLLTCEYQVVPAITPELMEEASKIRHRVFCEECGFFDKSEARTEFDEYDAHATQMLIFHRPTKSYIGCVRFIHGLPDKPQSLAFEKPWEGKIDYEVMRTVKENGHKYVEASRFAIDKDFRQSNKPEKNQAFSNMNQGVSCSLERSSRALITLYLGIQALAREHDIKYMFAVIEPSLARLFKRVSIPYVQVGEGMDYCRYRFPVMLDVDELETKIPFIFWPLYRSIRRQISSAYRSKQKQKSQYSMFNFPFLFQKRVPFITPISNSCVRQAPVQTKDIVAAE